LHSANLSPGDAQDGPALGNGYVYWVTAKYRGRGSGRLPVSTIYQRRIADGQTRVLLKGTRMVVTKLFATGDRVAFGLTRIDRVGKRGRTGLDTDEIYSMSAGDPAPTLLGSAKHKLIYSVTVRHREGHRYTSTDANECGNENVLEALDADGRMLVDEASTSCPNGKRVSVSNIYSITGAAAIRVTGIGNSFVTYLLFGKLITTPDKLVVVRDTASGASTRYPADLFTEQVAVDAAGNLATVSFVTDANKKFSSGLASAVKIFRAGETKPAAKILEPVLSIPTVVMCADGIVEITQIKGQTQMKLSLRRLDGSLVKRVDGPQGIFVYDATCDGRHLTIATQKFSEPPKTFGYDL
jgi:hypothetical protein